MGRHTYIGRNGILNGTDIGNYCSIAPGVQIGGMEHSHWWLSTSPRLSNTCVDNRITTIGHDVWIGAGVVVRQGVTIGNGAVVGALSFVNKDVPENSLCFGVPARERRKRLSSNVYEELVSSGYWCLSAKKAKAKLDSLEHLLQ